MDPEQEISIGCYRVSDRYVFPDEVNLSYDSLIYAPGSDLLVNTLSRGIIDISGQTAARMDPPYQPAVAGKSFPVIFVQPQQSSSPHSRKYIIFHFVSQFPSQPSIQFDQMSQEEIDYFPYAPISESGGTLKLKNTPAYPVWIRSFPAAATAHFSAIKSVGPTVSQPLRHLHTLRQFLAEEYTGELVDFAPSLSEAALQGAANSASLLETARKFRLISLDKLDIFITRFGTSEAQKNFTDFIQKTNSNLASDLIESQYQDVLHGNLWEGHPFHLVSLFSPQGSTVIVNPKDGINPPIESSMRGISGTLPVDKKNIFSFVREESP